MCATGLPVVSTLMKPIVGLTRRVVVAEGAEMIVRALGKVSRATMSDAGRADMESVCRRHDYDEKFSQGLRITSDEAKSRPRPEARLDPLIPNVLGLEWRVLGITDWQRWGLHSLGMRE